MKFETPLLAWSSRETKPSTSTSGWHGTDWCDCSVIFKPSHIILSHLISSCLICFVLKKLRYDCVLSSFQGSIGTTYSSSNQSGDNDVPTVPPPPPTRTLPCPPEPKLPPLASLPRDLAPVPVAALPSVKPTAFGPGLNPGKRSQTQRRCIGFACWLRIMPPHPF